MPTPSNPSNHPTANRVQTTRSCPITTTRGNVKNLLTTGFLAFFAAAPLVSCQSLPVCPDQIVEKQNTASIKSVWEQVKKENGPAASSLLVSFIERLLREGNYRLEELPGKKTYRLVRPFSDFKEPYRCRPNRFEQRLEGEFGNTEVFLKEVWSEVQKRLSGRLPDHLLFYFRETISDGEGGSVKVDCGPHFQINNRIFKSGYPNFAAARRLAKERERVQKKWREFVKKNPQYKNAFKEEGAKTQLSSEEVKGICDAADMLYSMPLCTDGQTKKDVQDALNNECPRKYRR